MSETTATVPARKCQANLLLGATLTSMLALNPTNPQVRAQVLSKCKQAIPPEHITFDAIVEWIETNIEQPLSATPDILVVDPPPHPRSPVALVVPISGGETEYGTCNYWVRNVGSGEVAFSRDELLEQAANSNSVEGLVDRIMNIIGEDWYDHVELSADEDGYDYEDYNQNDTGNSDWNVDCDLRLRVLEALQRIAPNELLRLRGEEGPQD